MFKVSLNLNNKPISLYSITKTPPVNWGESIVRLQQKYLQERTDDLPRDLSTTLSYLEQLVFSLQISEDEQLSQALIWSTVGLEELYLLFADLEVTEVFCNQIGSPMVITHRTHGRCITNVLFTAEMWNSLKIRAEYDSGRSLVTLNPALKLGFSSKLGNMRVSMQIPPLTPNSPAISIRRLPSSPIDLDTLISENQISEGFANLLKESIRDRSNIIIAGEPGSGKTTLANALLLESDPTWRLIIMEDAIEVIVPSNLFPMVTRFFMPSVGDDMRYAKRSDEIARLLHRSPDYVFLGELQNKDDTKVAFEGFSAGIRGIATTHARSLGGLLKRWQDSHQLAQGLLEVIDIIVFTTRELESGKSKLSTEMIYKREKDQFQEVRI